MSDTIDTTKNNTLPGGFVHLHVHTEYSLLDSSNKIKNYVKRIVDLGMTSAAITDHGNMYGVVEFYKTSKANGIKPILGCEVYVAKGSRLEKDTKVGEDRYYHLVLLAENNTGYQNLIKLVSIGYTEGFYYKPRVDMEVLEKYHNGIIALSACLAGELPRAILNKRDEELEDIVLKYQNIFGKENYFFELQDHGMPEQHTVNMGLMKLSKKFNIPLVITNDCHYTEEKDAFAHDALICMQTGKMLSDTDRMKYEGTQFYVKSEEEMRALVPYAPEAVDNTVLIAERCNVELEFGNYKIPPFELPNQYDNTYTYLNDLCENGFTKRYPTENKETSEIYQKMQYELGVIDKMGFVEYILIVWEYIKWAKTHGCAVGPGRGSAAGAIVCYCTGITDIDPIKYNLLFERFLNPERVSMPDIDVDFEYTERQRVIDTHIVDRYGKENVTQISTFQTMAARAVIKDTGRVLDYPYAERDKIAKMVPNELNITINKALEMNLELKALYEGDNRIKEWLDIAIELEGLPKSTSVHAAGVVIYPGCASDYVPLGRSQDGASTAQYNMVQLEELGCLKMDFLGLRTLTVIKDAKKNIKQSYGIDVDFDKIDVNDKSTLDFIGTGRTQGVFQLESAGMQSFMKELKPKNFEDIIAGISLYRPGPMDFIPAYIKGKNAPEEIVYSCPLLEPILAPTYGTIVYQEQVMSIVQELAGYTMGQADNIRRAMSKKKQYVIDEERKSFVYGDDSRDIKGCVANGIDEKVANNIYDSMVDFAKYAFNKSHAAAYAVVSFQTAWLKCYYPVEYMAALMTSVIDNTSKLTGYIQAAKNDGIVISVPDINKSTASFRVYDNKIRFALSGIDGISSSVAKTIEEEREKNGEYKEFADAVKRLTECGVNTKGIRNLIFAGAFSSMGLNERQEMLSYENIIEDHKKEKKACIEGQMSLFEMAENNEFGEILSYPAVEEYPKRILLMHEKEALNVYISGHPLEDEMPFLKKYNTHTSADLIRNEETGVLEVTDDQKIVIGGIIASVSKKFTKSNQQMGFVQLEDLYGTVEVIVFPKTYEKYMGKIIEDKKVLITGRITVEEEQNAKIICEKIESFDDMAKNIWIKFNNDEEFEYRKQDIYKLGEMDGKDTLVIYLADKKERSVHRGYCTLTDKLLKSLEDVYGKENVAITF